MRGNSLRFFIYFLLSTLFRDLAMMLCVHLLCGFYPLHSPLDCVLTYCRSTSQGRTDTGSHLILSTTNRLQLVSLHCSLGIFLWKTRCGLSSQGRKCWSIWNSVGKVFADPTRLSYSCLIYLLCLALYFPSCHLCTACWFYVSRYSGSVSACSSLSQTHSVVYVCVHSAFGLTSSRNRLIGSGVAGAITREYNACLTCRILWVESPNTEVSKSANRVEERKTGEARLKVCLFRHEPRSINRSTKKGNWGEKEFNKGSSSWLTGFCLSGESRESAE